MRPMTLESGTFVFLVEISADWRNVAIALIDLGLAILSAIASKNRPAPNKDARP